MLFYFSMMYLGTGAAFAAKDPMSLVRTAPGAPSLRIWLDVGAADQAMLDEGWYDAEHDGSVTFRWARSVATLLVPLHHGSDLSVQLRVRPFTFPGASQQTLRVRINGVPHGPFPLQPDWQDIRFETPRREWHSGLNRVVLECGRENVPAQVGAGADPRALAAAVDYFRVQQ